MSTFRSVLQLWILLSGLNIIGVWMKYVPPRIDLASEYVIHSNEDFNITCTSSEITIWEYPSRNNESTSIITEYVDKQNHRSILYIRNASYLDTGYFYCHEFGYDYLDISRSAKVYLFVEDEVHLIAGNESVSTVMASAFQSEVILPCRPTSPNVQVQLFKAGDEVQRQYDSKVGFILHDLRLKDEAPYICEFELSSATETKLISLQVIPNTTSIKKPTIEDLSMGHTTVGQTLTLNCSVYDRTVPIVFSWKIPARNNLEGNYIRSNTTSTEHVQYALLKIENVTKDDNGTYTCKVQDFNHNINSATLDVHVYGKNEHHILLNEENNLVNIQEHAGEPVYINVEVDAHPIEDLKLKWLNKHRTVLAEWEFNNNNPKTYMDNTLAIKYKADFKPTETTLEIKNINLLDYGHYTIVAENKFVKETKTFFLTVNDRPTIYIKMKDFHLYGRQSIITCEANASPSAKIHWKFKCFEQNHDCGLNDLNKRETVNGFTTISKINVTVRGSGEVSCYAENELGNENLTKTFYASDVANGFSLYTSENVITNQTQLLVPMGDVVKLYCQGSLYRYKNKFEWFFNDTRIQNDDNNNIESSTTQFSYKSTLNIQAPKTGEYKCAIGLQQSLLGNTKHIESIRLSVSNLEPPIIMDSNMGGTLYMELPDTLALTCYVMGIPWPSIVWMRNNMVIPLDNRTELLDGGQRLVFRKTFDTDEGLYTCAIENKVGKLSIDMNVLFNNKPKSIAILVSAIVVLAVIMLLIIIWSVRQCVIEKRYKMQLEELGLQGFKEGDINKINPDQGLSEQAVWLPYEEDRWEFPFDKLKLGKQLGSGAFGVVMKGKARGILHDDEETTVAVKTVRPDADTVHLRALMSELKIMGQIGKNLNVVNLLGACTTNLNKRQLYVIVEFCRYGNLQSYLLKHRKYFINQIDESGNFDFTIGPTELDRSFSISSCRSNSQSSQFSRNKRYPRLRSHSHSQESDYTGKTSRTDTALLPQTPTQEDTVTSNNSNEGPDWRLNYRGDYDDNQLLYSKDLLAWAFQVARGMDYLMSKKVLHRDLAARNILLADDNVVKICDFGLAKETLDYVKQSGDAPLPVKWMAVESIHDKVFSTQSDVWAYGIVLWEFFSLAKSPYPGMPIDDEFIRKILTGYRMEAPQFATKEMYQIMQACWEHDPTQRPSFKQLEERIGNILGSTDKQYYIDLNDPYLTPNNFPRETDYLSMFAPPDFEHISSMPKYANEWQTPDQSGYVCMKQEIFSPRPPEYQDNIFKYDSLSNDSGVELQPMLFGRTTAQDIESPQSPNAPSFPAVDCSNSISNPSYLKFDEMPIKHTPTQHTYQNTEAFNSNFNVQPSNNTTSLRSVNSKVPICERSINEHDEQDALQYANASTRDWDRIVEDCIKR